MVQKDVVLIVEDDSDIIEILSLYLGGSGYGVQAARTGEEGLALLGEGRASVALVDIMMPGMSGYDFIKQARSFSDIPIVIISARSQTADKMVGLDSGADGYITKPFDPMEVIAYVRAMLRRYRNEPASSGASLLTAGDLRLDTDRLLLFKRGSAIALTAAELKIMIRLMRSPGRVFTKAQLYEAVTGEPSAGGEESVMVHISNIRAKIEDDPNRPIYIVTVRGMGYRLEG